MLRKASIMASFVNLALITAICLILGCVHRQGSTAPVTPYEKLMAYNDILAQTNKNVGEGVMQLSPSVIPLDKGRAMVTAQRKLAISDQKLTNILNQGEEYSQAHAGDVNGLISDIQADALDLVNSGVAGVKNPVSQNNIDVDINLVANLAKAVYSQLELAGVLKGAK